MKGTADELPRAGPEGPQPQFPWCRAAPPTCKLSGTFTGFLMQAWSVVSSVSGPSPLSGGWGVKWGETSQRLVVAGLW